MQLLKDNIEAPVELVDLEGIGLSDMTPPVCALR
jgi:hypothetical protein